MNAGDVMRLTQATRMRDDLCSLAGVELKPDETTKD